MKPERLRYCYFVWTFLLASVVASSEDVSSIDVTANTANMTLLASQMTSDNMTATDSIISEKNSTQGTGQNRSDGVKNSAFVEVTSSVVDFVVAVGKFIANHIPFNVPVIGMGWKDFERAATTFRESLARADPASNPSTVVAVGVGAVAGPYIIEVIKGILASIIGFFDNIYFAATGQAFGRSDISDDVLEEILEFTVQRIRK